MKIEVVNCLVTTNRDRWKLADVFPLTDYFNRVRIGARMADCETILTVTAKRCQIYIVIC